MMRRALGAAAAVLGVLGASLAIGGAQGAEAATKHNYCVWSWGTGNGGWGIYQAAAKWNNAPGVRFYWHPNGCPKGATPVYVETRNLHDGNIGETYLLGTYDRIYLDTSYNSWSYGTKYSTSLHELGHVVGLNHVNDKTVMNPAHFYTYVSPYQYKSAH